MAVLFCFLISFIVRIKQIAVILCRRGVHGAYSGGGGRIGIYKRAQNMGGGKLIKISEKRRGYAADAACGKVAAAYEQHINADSGNGIFRAVSFTENYTVAEKRAGALELS